MRRAARAAGFLLPGLLCATAPLTTRAAAQERSLTLESFEAEIHVAPDASITVTETLEARFVGSWNGLLRHLSLRHETAEGRRQRLRLTVESATDGEGRPLEMEQERSAGERRLRIWVPGARDVTRTVVIRYRVANALRFFPEGHPTGHHDELYLNVTGNEWEIPIRRAVARVVLPDGATGVQAWGYTGYAGSTAQDVEVRVAGTEARVASTRDFAPGEGLTVSVTWDPGVVARPGAVSRLSGRARAWWPLGLPFLAVFLMFRTWDRHGRDPARRAVPVQYDPPDGLTPAEVGTLVDHKAEMHDITAILVDLAVRGYVTIEEKTEKRFLGLSKSTDYVFHLRRPRNEWGGLLEHERRYLDALFLHARPAPSRRGEEGSGLDQVALSDLKDKFYKHLSGIRDAIYDGLVRQGYYDKRPDRVKGLYLGLAAALLVGAVLGAALGGEWGVVHPIPALVGLMGSAFIVGGFGLVMPARTEKGARAMEGALGFKEFMARVEQPRYRRMITSPELFEKYLPFAMAFQVEARWAKAFEDIYRTPPEWYQGSSGSTFRASSFSRQLSSMASAASATTSSSPSGSGGGGSSGGGSGGGGGGGF